MQDIEESKLGGRYPAPKSGIGHNVSSGKRWCKGICDLRKRPYGDPYKQGYCRCAGCCDNHEWILVSSLKGNRCSCCNRQAKRGTAKKKNLKY